MRTRHRSRIRPRLARGASGQGARPAPEAAPAPPSAPQLRERSAGGPEDRALYRCSCGYVFEASVSASVGCPHCGDAQAW